MHVGIKRINPLDMVSTSKGCGTDTKKIEVCKKAGCQLESTMGVASYCVVGGWGFGRTATRQE